MKVITNQIQSEFPNPILYYGCKEMDASGYLRVESADSIIVDGGDSYIRIPLSKKYSKRGRTVVLGNVKLYSRDSDVVKKLCKLIGDWVAHHN